MTKVLRTFSRDEVAKHNSADDCYVTIDNKVYNVTHWLKKHPGGFSILFNLAGQDCTDEFRIFHLEPNLKLLNAFYVGDLIKSEQRKETQVTKDLAKLHEKFRSEGLFEPDCKFFFVIFV